MSTELFECRSHLAPCQHIRQYPRAISTQQEDGLQSHVKQYIPRDNPNPKKGDITVVATHALGYPKELYEPLFDEPPSASYLDWARDTLLMINHFREEMPRPLVGLGHSMGACSLVNTALFHPRLFASVILIEPALNRMHRAMNFGPIYAIATKRDRWPSRAAAASWCRRNPFLKAFDTRVLDLYVKYGFRELPTLQYPESAGRSSTQASPSPTWGSLSPQYEEPASAARGSLPEPPSKSSRAPGAVEPSFSFTEEKPVTLTITRDHDVSLFARGAYPSPGKSLSASDPDPSQYPDISASDFRSLDSPFYRPETVLTFMQLPFLRPSCLYIYGETSTFTSASLLGRADKLSITGTATGGSGGHAAGKVEDRLLKGTGHFCPFERPADVAEALVPWIVQQLRDWEERERDPKWESMSIRERGMLDDQWLKFAKEYLGSKKETTRSKL
ncbi:MAG: hypothetical protein Q9162_007300 [Coniocarpon cinnabarinum]